MLTIATTLPIAHPTARGQLTAAHSGTPKRGEPFAAKLATGPE